MIASQPLPGQVSETVHPTVVEEQVGVDLHHGLDWALGHVGPVVVLPGSCRELVEVWRMKEDGDS